MAELTIEVDMVGLIDKHIASTIDNFINKENETFGYWTLDLKDVVQQELAKKFVEKYYEEIFANIARDETLTILIREKVVAEIAKGLKH